MKQPKVELNYSINTRVNLDTSIYLNPEDYLGCEDEESLELEVCAKVGQFVEDSIQANNPNLNIRPLNKVDLYPLTSELNGWNEFKEAWKQLKNDCI